MPSVADFLVKRVKDKGWFSVGCLYVDNCYAMNPFDLGGRICMSESAQVIIIPNQYDSVNTAILDNYMAHDPKYIGFHQTVSIFGFDHLQHFDANLFQYSMVYPEGADQFILPEIPTADEINAIVLDPDTGMVDGYPVGRQLNKKEMALYDVHPNLPTDKAFGIKIAKLQSFYRDQKQFAQAMNTFLDLNDCI